MADIFATVGENMPRDRPATVPTKELADILSFLMQANHIPPGQRELPDNWDQLQRILFLEKLPDR